VVDFRKFEPITKINYGKIGVRPFSGFYKILRVHGDSTLSKGKYLSKSDEQIFATGGQIFKI